MRCRNLFIVITLFLVGESLAYGCVDPDFDVWLDMKPKELSQYGCVKDHVKLEIMSRKDNAGAVIEIAKELRSKGLLDKPSLQREAEALYKLGLFKEALNARLLSLTKPNKCEVFVDCLWEFTDAVVHYENAKYYRAAGYLDNAEEELNAGDLKFDKICPRSGKNADYCIGVHDRLIEYFPTL
jgi:tetratricopeptide (TPR) repeat protein